MGLPRCSDSGIPVKSVIELKRIDGFDVRLLVGSVHDGSFLGATHATHIDTHVALVESFNVGGAPIMGLFDAGRSVVCHVGTLIAGLFFKVTNCTGLLSNPALVFLPKLTNQKST